MLKERIQHLLSTQRRTVKELAKHIGMTDTAIRNIYARNSCELSTLRKMADFFNVPTTDLLEESDGKISINDVERSFNTGLNDNETIKKLTSIIDEQRKRIDELTDRLLTQK